MIYPVRKLLWIGVGKFVLNCKKNQSKFTKIMQAENVELKNVFTF